jgi:alpha-N-arabinofuranosidase
VVNRHPTESIPADLELEDKRFSGPVEISEVNGPDIKSQNDFQTTTVKTMQRIAQAEGRKFTYSFPAHSYSMLKAKLV